MACRVADSGRKEPITAATAKAALTDAPADSRRRRRTREDVTERICDAARQLFAARGYHGATTREIARVADVSETLLFRYYGSKAVLFGEVVAQPFNDLLQDFLEKRPNNADPQAQEHDIFMAIYELIEKNQALFTALLSAKGGPSDEGGAPSYDGFLTFFRASTKEQMQKYLKKGEEPSFDVGLGLRLAFGMLAGSVLLRDWLFPDGQPPREQIVSTLEQLVGRALDPVGGGKTRG